MTALAPAAKAKYFLTADVVIPYELRVEPDAFPIGPIALPELQDLKVAIVSTAPRETRMTVSWMLEMPFDQDLLSKRWRPSDSASLSIPGDDGRPVVVPLESMLRHALTGLVTRLAYATKDVWFFDAFMRADYREMIPRIDVKVGAASFSVPVLAIKQTGFAPWSRRLNSAELTATLTRTTRRFEYYGVRADARWTTYDDQGAIIWLTTQLEVAAYEYVGSRLGDRHFKPPLYLGQGYRKLTGNYSFDDLCLDRGTLHYARCCELWGARHEIIHNGRQQVRVFDAKLRAEVPGNVRPLVPGDVEAFREAVAHAIEWLKTA